jgi:hypothetical protein
MFSGCIKFNQPLHKRVTNMVCMFFECKKFNHSLNKWNINNVTNKNDMFRNCPIKNDYKPIVKQENFNYKKEKLEVDEELIKQHLHPSRIASIINSTTDGMM